MVQAKQMVPSPLPPLQTHLAWISSILVCMTSPSSQISMNPGWRSGEAILTVVGGWALALLSYPGFLFGYSKDFEEINRDHFTPFIL